LGHKFQVTDIYNIEFLPYSKRLTLAITQTEYLG